MMSSARSPLRSAILAGCSAVLLLGGCNETPAPDSSRPSQTPPPTAPEPPAPPEVGGCYRLGFDEAVSPTTTVEATECNSAHTSETFFVGTMDLEQDGHRLAVDSDRVQRQVAQQCPRNLSKFLGGDPDSLRLSMVQPVWFTPTLEESDKGADWFRCDAVVVSGPDKLKASKGSLRGVLADERRADPVAMCGTAAPDDPKFRRVACAEPHSWRAVTVVPFESTEKYPGEPAVRDQGDGCEDAALDFVDDPLKDWAWGYEWPTKAQWDTGMTFGRCWVSS